MCVISVGCLSSVNAAPTDSLRRENLGPNVNSSCDEISPVVSADGKTLYFSRRDCSTNTGDSSRDDIYVSTYSDTEWTRAVNIGQPLNTDDYNDVAAVSSDGNTLLLYNVYNLDGSLERGFSMTHREGSTWSAPQKILIHDFKRYTNSQSIEATLSSDGTVLVMTLTNNSAMGNKDIYVSFLLDAQEREWSAPMNIGTVVNSPYSEISPFLAADGTTLYFASTRPGGVGDADMYVTHRLDSTWIAWSAPENLGSQINTPGFDAYYTIPAEGTFAYFVSDAPLGYGKFDIYRIALPRHMRPDAVIAIQGKVIGSNDEPLEATVSCIELESKHLLSKKLTARDGTFSFTVPVGKEYRITASKENYSSAEVTIDARSDRSYHEVKSVLRLEEQNASEKIIYFETGSFAIDDEYVSVVENVAHFLQEHSDHEVEITGYTDNVGSVERNDELSSRRANAVVRYLLRLGVGAKQLSVEGRGTQEPRASNTTKEGRAQNRRVEIKIIQ